MYGLYGLKHHTVEMLPCGTDKRRTREDKATQPLDDGRLSFAIFASELHLHPQSGEANHRGYYPDPLHFSNSS